MQETTRGQIEVDGADVTPDCCPQWRVFAPLFQWATFVDFPGLACMPYVVEAGAIALWRVNHCPACGADRRGAIMWVDDLSPPKNGCPMQLVVHSAAQCKEEKWSPDDE